MTDPTCTFHALLMAEVKAGLSEMRLPQAWLAHKAGYSEKHVSQMLTGQAEGSLVAWEALLAVVGRWPLTHPIRGTTMPVAADDHGPLDDEEGEP